MRGIVALLVATGCTTLGPMPGTTAIPAGPAGKPGGEAQLGFPAFHLSSSASNRRGRGTGPSAVLVEPDRWISAPGLLVNARLFGKGDDTPVELGDRGQLGLRFALMTWRMPLAVNGEQVGDRTSIALGLPATLGVGE